MEIGLSFQMSISRVFVQSSKMELIQESSRDDFETQRDPESR